MVVGGGTGDDGVVVRFRVVEAPWRRDEGGLSADVEATVDGVDDSVGRWITAVACIGNVCLCRQNGGHDAHESRESCGKLHDFDGW